MDWQPIETAPTNGEIVLVTDGKLVHVGCYQPTADWGWHFFDTAFFEAFFEGKERMVTEANAWPIDDGPTHWMPLPAPPTPSQG